MHKILFKLMIVCHRLVKGIANRILDKKHIRPRHFSNMMLREYAPYLKGSVINVSGWKDSDGIGGKYKDYFTHKTTYTISNVGGQGKGFGSAGDEYDEVEIDLERDLPSELVKKFDIVFNHTTLEHIFNFKKAFRNLCLLSNDVVVITVPVMQQIHHTKDFGDYWRPTTMVIARLFLENGFEPLVIKCNDQPFAPIYCFAIAVRDSTKYADSFNKHLDFEMGKYNYGSSLKTEHISDLL